MSKFVEMLLAATEVTLPQRERDMFQMRYGLNGSPPMTLQEIADVYSLSRERIRQVIQRAMRKLHYNARHAVKSGKLDTPIAQLLLCITDGTQNDDADNIEAILDFVEAELSHLPAYTHSLPLVNYLTIERERDTKARLEILKARAKQRRSNQRHAERQKYKLEQILEHVIWPPKIAAWDVDRVYNTYPPLHQQRSEDGEQFFSTKMQQDVPYFSDMQRQFLQRLDVVDKVIHYQRHPFMVRYAFNETECRSTADYLFLLEDGRAVVTELIPVFYMGLANNLAKWSELRRVCAEQGFGLLVTDGRRSIQEIQRTPVRAEVAAMLLQRLASGNLTWVEYDAIRQEYGIKNLEFQAIILNNRLHWRLSPFSLSLS